ncbi:MAG: orotate phosphoribosyltransferase [Candidatus Delongbacteria bacterium]|nr:orotate phosphoribosyltransferase [Candidatus Delongbacteria bacterium]MBN2834636.1 orotate phosphoribosyltransferase [Candidatus Delongbacteria bacterium]
MSNYKNEFIKFLLDNGSLKFGEFTLKSGRLSPYFLNTGMLYSSEGIMKLGHFYASAINEKISEYNVVFGPAYKGIPLAVSAVVALKSKFDINCNYSFNRKEVKDHGDGGLFVGKKIESDDKIIIIDDVITAGTAIRETVEILRGSGDPKIVGIVVSVDRMEKGKGDFSAIQEIYQMTGINVIPIVTILDIIEFLEVKENRDMYKIDESVLAKMYEYRKTYGV